MTKYCELIMHSLIQYLLLSLFHLNDFLHFDIPWMIDFLFSSFHPNAQKRSAAFVLMNFIQGYVCIIAVKTSNVFYLCLL